MANATNCSKCKIRFLDGVKYPYKGKVYCYDCFQEICEEEKKNGTQKDEIFKMIKDLFSVSEVPDEVIYAVERELANGKTPKGISSTLWYYYRILGNKIDRDKMSNIVFVIRDKYNEAKKYAAKNKELKEKNAQVDLTPTKIEIKVTEGSLGTGRKKKMYELK